jgi:hypothetical protein
VTPGYSAAECRRGAVLPCGGKSSVRLSAVAA